MHNTGWRSNYLRYKSYFLDIGTLYRERADLRAYLEIILSLLTVSVFALFALKPTLLTIAELIRQIEVKRETLSQMNSKIKDIRTAQTLYDKQGEKLKYLEQAIPSLASPDTLTRQMEGLAINNNVSLDKFSVNETLIYGLSNDSLAKKSLESVNPILPNSNAVNFEATFMAPMDEYPQLVNLIKDMQNLRWPLKIDKLDFKSGINTDKELVMVMVVEGRLPFSTKEM